MDTGTVATCGKAPMSRWFPKRKQTVQCRPPLGYASGADHSAKPLPVNGLGALTGKSGKCGLRAERRSGRDVATSSDLEGQLRNNFERLARLGYAARGVVYAILGSIALLGAGAEATPEGAFSTLLAQPLGRVLLGAVALGLVGHVLWRLAQAFLDADHHGSDAKAIAIRAGNFGSALANGALALGALAMAVSSAGSNAGSDGQQGAVATVMGLPFGNVLLGLGGLALVVAGVIQVWRGLSGSYRKRVRLPQSQEALLRPVCGAGLAARGLLLAVTGGFIIYAAIVVSPEQAGGTAQALDWLRSLPFGTVLYAAAAIGLVAFGLYSFIEARYRHVDAPGAKDIRDGAAKVSGVKG
jgi:hypothetical protein